MTTMNATSLYVSFSRIVLEANADNPNSLADLCRLMPYLRQSLSCTVCGNLLNEPLSPATTNCQHHVCKNCKGGRKNLKPVCSWCKNYNNYLENVQLRILMQCYKKICEYVKSTPLYRLMHSCPGEGNIKDFIDEGASLKDEYKSQTGLSKSAYSILPCVYTHAFMQPPVNIFSKEPYECLAESNGAVLKKNGSSTYSVSYQGSGNKMGPLTKRPMPRSLGKTRQIRPVKEERKIEKEVEKKTRDGCRCGNATVTPGKLTCCGQRCPCYVVPKACMDCKCRGCRNPHTKEGQKVIREVLNLKS